MSRVQTVILIGPHSAGKTTIGHGLAHALGWRFDEELGDRLRRQALAIDPAAHASRPQPGFDEQVLQSELERDTQMADGGPRIVETWHLGNLAYAKLRSPHAASRMADRVRTAIARSAERGLIVQPLCITEATLRARQREPGPPDIAGFFLQVSELANRLAFELGLDVAPPLATDQLSPEAALACLLPRIAR